MIEEKVVKVDGRAEADRFFNYPYNALEEALVNAVLPLKSDYKYSKR